MKYPYKFKVKILGTGSALPTKYHLPSSQFIKINNDRFLMDCGEFSQFSMVKNDISLYKIDAIFISHLHGDHFFGLPGLLSTLCLMKRTNDLKIIGPYKLKNIIETIMSLDKSRLTYKIDFIVPNIENNITEKIFEAKNTEVYAFKLKHNIECYGYLFKEKKHKRKLLIDKIDSDNIEIKELKKLKDGENIKTLDNKTIYYKDVTITPPLERSYVYCSDTKYFKEIEEVCKDVSLIYHEATFVEDDRKKAEKTNHSTSKDAAIVARNSNAKLLLIGHLSSKYINPSKSLKEARDVFKETYIAEEYKDYCI